MNDGEDPENTQARLILGIRKIVPFSIGAKREVQVLRSVQTLFQSYSPHYADFLNKMSPFPLREPSVGSCFNPQSIRPHHEGRNRLVFSGNTVIEAMGANIRIIDNAKNYCSWERIFPLLSTRSICTGITCNPNLSFGFAITKSKSMCFGMYNNQFTTTSFFETPERFIDAKTSSFIPGETVSISPTGTVYIYDKDRLVKTIPIDRDPSNCSSICFANHPRIVVASTSNDLVIYDLRIPDPLTQAILRSNISEIISYDRNSICCFDPGTLSIIDLRFPLSPRDQFQHDFNSPVVSSCIKHIDGFTCVVAHCAASSEVLYFPITEGAYAAPISPFEALSRPFLENDLEFLTGVALPDDRAILQFENGTVIGLELDKHLPPCSHLFSSLYRAEVSFPNDHFYLKPEFQNLPPPVPSEWTGAFDEIKENPPVKLFDPPPAEEFEDIGDGYLSEHPEAFEMDDETLDQALPLLWQNHMKHAKALL